MTFHEYVSALTIKTGQTSFVDNWTKINWLFELDITSSSSSGELSDRFWCKSIVNKRSCRWCNWKEHHAEADGRYQQHNEQQRQLGRRQTPTRRVRPYEGPGPDPSLRQAEDLARSVQIRQGQPQWHHRWVQMQIRERSTFSNDQRWLSSKNRKVSMRRRENAVVSPFITFYPLPDY